MRRKILRLLAANRRTFSEILGQVDVESSHLSYHLENLSGLIRKRNGAYSLTDVGRAAVSLMSRVEEPATTGLLLKKSLLSLLRTSRRTWFVSVVALGLMISLFTNIYLISSNSQLNSILENEKQQVVNNVAFSLEALSSGGFNLPGPMTRVGYSNLSLVHLAIDQIVIKVHYGRESLHQLITLDLQHEKDLLIIDDLFKSFGRFANLLSMLIGENKTSTAVMLIERISNSVNDYPLQIGSKFRSAYGTVGRVHDSTLRLASEDADMLRNMVDEIMMQAVGSTRSQLSLKCER